MTNNCPFDCRVDQPTDDMLLWSIVLAHQALEAICVVVWESVQ